jgi:hypothetical protein
VSIKRTANIHGTGALQCLPIGGPAIAAKSIRPTAMVRPGIWPSGSNARSRLTERDRSIEIFDQAECKYLLNRSLAALHQSAYFGEVAPVSGVKP